MHMHAVDHSRACQHPYLQGQASCWVSTACCRRPVEAIGVGSLQACTPFQSCSSAGQLIQACTCTIHTLASQQDAGLLKEIRYGGFAGPCMDTMLVALWSGHGCMLAPPLWQARPAIVGPYN